MPFYRFHSGDSLGQMTDMLRCRAAAAADQHGSGIDHLQALFGKVFRSCAVDVAAIDEFREAGVGKGGKRPSGPACKFAQGNEYLPGTCSAVGTDEICSGLGEFPGCFRGFDTSPCPSPLQV